jgi:hypothetical protein
MQSSSDINILQNYTKKMIYCGTQNNVLLLVYIIHIQNQNKVVEFLVAWLFTMPHFEDVLINYDQMLLKGIVANYYWKGLLVFVLIMVMHF